MNVLEKLNDRIDATNSLLCVGLDSELSLLPKRFRRNADITAAMLDFNRWIIDQTIEYAAAYKLNSAFYEAHGVAGWRALRRTMEYLRAVAPGVFTIIDAKRADIGNTNTQYATAFYDELGCDAVTLHPWLGGEALAPFLERDDKAAIVLCHTSNPGAGELQGLTVTEPGAEPMPLWRVLARRVAEQWNGRGNCMLVIGATVPDVIRQAREDTGDMPFLVPGIGAQGGDLGAVLDAGLTPGGHGLLINASRSVIFATDPGAQAKALQLPMAQRRQGTYVVKP